MIRKLYNVAVHRKAAWFIQAWLCGLSHEAETNGNVEPSRRTDR